MHHFFAHNTAPFALFTLDLLLKSLSDYACLRCLDCTAPPDKSQVQLGPKLAWHRSINAWFTLHLGRTPSTTRP